MLLCKSYDQEKNNVGGSILSKWICQRASLRSISEDLSPKNQICNRIISLNRRRPPQNLNNKRSGWHGFASPQ